MLHAITRMCLQNAKVNVAIGHVTCECEQQIRFQSHEQQMNIFGQVNGVSRSTQLAISVKL